MPDLNQYDRILKGKHNAFFIAQLVETGLPLELNHFKARAEERITDMEYMSPDPDGNVRFDVPDILSGGVETYLIGDPPHQKERDWHLVRWREPKMTKEGPAKYTPAPGGGTRVLITPPVIDAFNKKEHIPTLYFVEGFKKALSAYAANGLPIIGMNGLSGFKEPGDDTNRLRKEVKEILTTCTVSKIVVLYDSDLYELSESFTKKGEPATKRPNVFFRAALLAKTLFEPFGDVYLAHPARDPSA